jgi:serine phosphatase RsbU (regulator of sigma subunit)
MPDPFYYTARTGEIAELPVAGGPPLGLSGGGSLFKETTIRLEPGDKLIAYSDGLSEACRGDGELFGAPADRLLDRLEALTDLSAPEMGRSLVSEWESFHEGKQEDDCTLVILEKLT